MKWIGVLIAGLLVIFGVAAAILAVMGGLDNHGQSQATTTVDAPIDLVFEWASETTHTPRWVRRLKTSSPITKGDLKKDAMIREVLTTPKGTYELTGTFVDYDPPNALTVEYIITGWTPKGGKLVAKNKGDEPVTTVTSQFSFEKIDDAKTHVSYEVNTEYNGWYMRLMEPMATYGGTKSMESNLIDFKSRVEAEHKRAETRRKKAEERKKKKKQKAQDKKDKKAKSPKSEGTLAPSGNIDLDRKTLMEAIRPPEFKPILPDKEK